MSRLPGWYLAYDSPSITTYYTYKRDVGTSRASAAVQIVPVNERNKREGWQVIYVDHNSIHKSPVSGVSKARARSMAVAFMKKYPRAGYGEVGVLE